MKTAAIAAAAAALAGGADASGHGHAHAHQDRDLGESCSAGCTTYYTTMTGEGWLHDPSASALPTPASGAGWGEAGWSEPTATWSVEGSGTVPTPYATQCHSTGVYTFPAWSLTLTDPTTVPGAWTTSLPSAGFWTLGGITTVVDQSTEFECPVGTTEVNDGTATTILHKGPWTLSSAGTWTLGAITTSVATPCTVVVPEVTSYDPGVWSKPEEVITVTENEYVYYCPWSSAAWSTSITPGKEAVATPKADPTKAAPSSETWAIPAASYTAKTDNNGSSVKTPPSGSSAGIGGTDGKWAITLSPYGDSGSCKPASQIMTEMGQIHDKGISTVRVYSTDCDTLSNFGAAAKKYGMKLIVGVYVSATGCSNANPDVATQIASLAAWEDYSLAELVIVANEAMFNNWCTVDELASLLTEVRTKLHGAGWTAPITTTDTVGAWTSTAGVSALCPLMDVIACNAYAFFNHATLPGEAGTFVAGQLALVEAVCPGLDGWVTETGWPSQGCECYGSACASSENQATAIKSILGAVGNKAVLLSAFDETWKAPGQYCVEQHWGCLDSI